MTDEPFDLDKHIADPKTQAKVKADLQNITRSRAAPSIVTLDEERQRRKRGSTAKSKRAIRSDAIQWPDVTEHGSPRRRAPMRAQPSRRSAYSAATMNSMMA